MILRESSHVCGYAFFPDAFRRFAAQYAFILRDVAFLPAADIPPRL